MSGSNLSGSDWNGSPNPQGDSDGAYSLRLMPGRYALCRLDPSLALPEWATGETLLAITRTPAELSVLCEESLVPHGVLAEKGWCALEVAGPFEFTAVGVLASLLNPLAAARVSILALSTFDTDYVLVKQTALPAALVALREAGHVVEESYP